MIAKAQSAPMKGVTRAETTPPLAIDFGRAVCGSLEAAEQREWLVTNGIGGFASGTVAGSYSERCIVS